MNVQLLIDSIFRQTTVLVAQLATAGGIRAPLASVANQVFLDLADELNSQGVSRRVSADMFGLALRTYLRKIQRLRESSTDSGTSLWEAILGHLGEGKLVTRADVLRRFHRDDPEIVRGVLHDLSESGLVMRVGNGPSMAYRAVTKDELLTLAGARDTDGTDELLWAIIYREGPISHEALTKLARHANVEAATARLIGADCIRSDEHGGTRTYRTERFFVSVNAEVGWEGAVFDHIQAVVKTICARLRGELHEDAATGGSTYSFDVWPGHPLEAEVLGLLGRLRETTSALRARLSAYNAVHARPSEYAHVTFYGGQTVVREGNSSEV